MRILQVAFKSQITGAEAVLLDLARGCLAAGHDVHAALPADGPLAAALAELGCTCHVIPMRKTYDLPAAWRLARLIRRERIDLVHSHGLLVNLLTRAACRLAGRTRCVNTVHLTRHLAVGGRGEGWRQRWINRYYRAADNLSSAAADRIIAVSNAVAEDLLAQGVRPGRITVIQNGVAAPPRTEHDLRAELGLAPDCPIVGTIARLSPQKDMFTWLAAAERVAAARPDAAFVIIGDGPLGDALKARAGEKAGEGVSDTRREKVSDTRREKVSDTGLRGRVHFLGYRTDARALLRQFDLFLLTSLWEGLPLVVLEAMAAGVPVVATAVDGTVEAIEPGRSGLLRPPGDASGLAEAAVSLLADDGLRRRIGEAGRARWEQRFSLERMVRETLAVYDRAARGPAEHGSGGGRKRVCFVNLFDRIGGGERSLIELIDGLDAGRIEPHAIVPRPGPLAGALAARGVSVHLLPLGRAERASRFGGRAGIRTLVAGMAAACRLGRLLRRIGADVVVSNNLKAHVLAAPVCRVLRRPLVWHFRDILPAGLLRRAVAALGRRATRRIVANSLTTAEQFAGLPAGRLCVVYNGIGEPAAAPRDEAQAAGPRVGVVGALAPGKGQEQVIRAIASLPRVRLDLIGGELYRTAGQPVGFGGRLAELARRLGCEGRVRFLGHRPDAASLMAGYDLVVCPSQLAESFCRVGVEALAAGVPVVASDVGAVREVCGQWPAVRYVRGGDVAAWMAAVRDALADSRMRQAARQDGPAYVRRRFSLRTYQSRMQRVILSAT